MTAHAQLKALKDKYMRLLVASQRMTQGFTEAEACAQEAQELVYATIVDDLEDALRVHEGE